MILIICLVFVFATIVCYAAVYAGARADIENQKYWEEKKKNELYGQSEWHLVSYDKY